MKHALALITALGLVVTNWATADEDPNLDDPKVREVILKEAVLLGSLERRGPDGEKLFYQRGAAKQYTGWTKQFHDHRQVKLLAY